MARLVVRHQSLFQLMEPHVMTGEDFAQAARVGARPGTGAQSLMRQLLIAISAMREKEYATSADCRCTSGSVSPSLCCSGGRPAKRRKRTFLHIANHHSTIMPWRNAGEKSPEGRNSAPKLRCSGSVSNRHLSVTRALSLGLMPWRKS